MKRLMALACSAALAAGMLATTGNDASARDWHRHGGWHHRHHHGGWGTGAAIGAGIIGGAIIGGALANPYYGPYYDPYYRPYYRPRVIYRSRPVYRTRIRMSDAHVEWCYDRYRSYRAYDNTFQPYHGPRRQCYSPYD